VPEGVRIRIQWVSSCKPFLLCCTRTTQTLS